MSIRPGIYNVRFVPPGSGAEELIGGMYATAGELGQPIRGVAQGAVPVVNQNWIVEPDINNTFIIRSMIHNQAGWGLVNDDVPEIFEPVLLKVSDAKWRIEKVQSASGETYSISPVATTTEVGASMYVGLQDQSLFLVPGPVIPEVPVPSWTFTPIDG
ncbi:hypothetical protein CVT24_004392 [Panaeolus cyanescens]|uniref:Uncharacterized protein n=1 Tax=Panaeolus cyanescens TaxID=181874 RepID=A0A409YBH0_9AGAR|nr:hypothetical protein CVT24_004392 [Panaeolus cyanescens]